MREEIKISIICIVLSLSFIFVFSYISSISEQTYYLYQVGIYKDEINKDKKINELNEKGCEGMFYMKNDQYYVVSLITTDKKKIEEHASVFKGIIKEYKVANVMSDVELLKELEKGDLYD